MDAFFSSITQTVARTVLTHTASSINDLSKLKVFGNTPLCDVIRENVTTTVDTISAIKGDGDVASGAEKSVMESVITSCDNNQILLKDASNNSVYMTDHEKNHFKILFPKLCNALIQFYDSGSRSIQVEETRNDKSGAGYYLEELGKGNVALTLRLSSTDQDPNIVMILKGAVEQETYTIVHPYDMENPTWELQTGDPYQTAYFGGTQNQLLHTSPTHQQPPAANPTHYSVPQTPGQGGYTPPPTY